MLCCKRYGGESGGMVLDGRRGMYWVVALFFVEKRGGRGLRNNWIKVVTHVIRFMEGCNVI